MHATADIPDLGIGAAQTRIELAGIEFDSNRRWSLAGPTESVQKQALHSTFRLPGPYVNELFRESLGIARRSERFFGQNRGGLMVSMAVARSAGERHHQNVGPELADNPDHIGQDLVLTPFLQSFVQRFGIPKIDGAGEKLFPAIDSPGRQQLLGTDQS